MKKLFSLVLFLLVLVGVAIAAPPVIDPIADQIAVEDQYYDYTATATDADGDPFNFTLQINPTGMTIGKETGLIDWTPTTAQIGVHDVQVNATDNNSESYLQNFSIEVKPRLEITNVDFTIGGSTETVQDNEVMQEVPPNSDITLDITLKNNGNGAWDAISGIPNGIKLEGDIVTSSGVISDQTNLWVLDVGEQETLSLQYHLPAIIPEGIADVNLEARGRTILIPNLKDNFTFQINVTKDILDLLIVDYGFENDTVTCDKVADLNFTVANIGQYDPLWYNVRVISDELGMIDNTNYTFLPANTNANFTVPVNVTDEPMGTYHFDIEVWYYWGLLYKVEDIALQNNNCPLQFDTTIPDVEFLEDMYNDTIGSLDDYILDVDDGSTTFVFTGDDNLNLNLDGDNALTITADQDWNGVRDVMLTATDLGGSDSTNFTVTVLPVNDEPVIDDIPDQPALEDQEFVYIVTSSDVENDTIAYSLTNEPASMVIDSANGTISGFTPTNAMVGDVHNITVTADDGTDSTDLDFLLTVQNVNDAPTINSTPGLAAVEDSEYAYQVTAADIDNDTISFSLAQKPTGMIISNGLINWTPLNEHVGDNLVEVQANDGNGGLDNQTFNITVTNINDAPVLDPIADVTAKQGETIAFTVTAVDVDPTNDTLTYSMTPTPTGASLNSASGEFSWVPSNIQFGDYEIEFSVNDGLGATNSSNATITVLSVLKITDIDVSVDNPEDGISNFNNLVEGDYVTAEAGDTLTLDVTIKNDHEGTYMGDPKVIADIIAEAAVPTLSLSDDTPQFNLGPQESIEKTLSFVIPPDSPAVFDYALTVDVQGEDDFGSGVARQDTVNLLINITKDRHNVVIDDLALAYNNLKCVRKSTLNVTVFNVGKVAEDDINVTVENSDLGIFESLMLPTLNDGNSHMEPFSFDITDADVGTYPIDASIEYYNGWGTDSGSVDLIIEACSVDDQSVPEDTLPDFTVELEPLGLSTTSYAIDSQNASLILCSIASKQFTCAKPAANETGTSHINISITDGPYTNSVEFDVEVEPVNDAPYFIGILPDVSIDEDTDYYYDMDGLVDDVDNDVSELTISNDFIHSSPILSNNSFRFSVPTPGDYPVEMTVEDPQGETESQTINVSVIDVPEAPEFTAIPSFDNVNIVDGADYIFSVSYSDPDAGDIVTVEWFVNGGSFATDDNINLTDSDYSLGSNTVNVTLTDGTFYVGKEWNVEVTNAPLFDGSEIAYTGSDNTAATDVIIENANGRIVFDGPIDLTKLHDLDEYVKIEEGVVAIDTSVLDELVGESATVTLYGLTYDDDPEIYFNNGFTTDVGSLAKTKCTSCTLVSADPAPTTTGTVVFETTGFSTYWVMGNKAPIADAGVDFTAYIGDTIELDGSASSDPDSDPITYSWTSTSNMTLSDPTAQKPTFSTTTAGDYTFELVVNDGSIDSASDSVTITVTERPMLEISDLEVKVNGEKDKDVDNGDKIGEEGKPGETIEFKIEVSNLYDRDSDIKIENVEVTVTIEDLDDGDDVEEEDEIDEIKAGKDEDVKIELDIPLEVDEDTYVVTILVEGEDEDDNFHEIEWNLQIDVDKDKHELILRNINLNPEQVVCNRRLTLDGTVVNIGSEDEDSVDIEISSPQLSISDAERDIELDEGTDDDTKESFSFRFTIDDKIDEGSYPIDVKALYDGKESDKETVNLIVKDCVEEVEEEDVLYVYEDEPEIIYIDEEPEVTEEEPEPTEIAFRETDEYLIALIIGTVLLGGLIVFMLGAVVIMMTRKR